MIENLNELISDKYGYYSEEDLKKNWINTDKLEDITIQLARQAMYQADRIYNQDKQLQQLKQENEELRKSNTSNAKAFLKENKEKHKLLDCLDEIEEICKENYYNDSWAKLTLKLDAILQKIKQAKEGK